MSKKIQISSMFGLRRVWEASVTAVAGTEKELTRCVHLNSPKDFYLKRLIINVPIYCMLHFRDWNGRCINDAFIFSYSFKPIPMKVPIKKGDDLLPGLRYTGLTPPGVYSGMELLFTFWFLG